MSLNITLLIDFHDCSSLSETANNGIKCVNFAFINVLYSFIRLLLDRCFVVLCSISPTVPYVQALSGSDTVPS